jgi:hypothetical protein
MKTSGSAKIFKIIGISFSLTLAVLFSGCSEAFLSNHDSSAYAPSCDLSRDFDWYKTQMDSGPAARNNCGPACVSMAAKYAQRKDIGVDALRNVFYVNGGWWYSAEVKNALTYLNINYNTIPLLYKEQILASLSNGHLVIICLNMSILSKEERRTETRYNRYYDHVTGHFLVLKGYTEGKQWLIAYDPNNWGNDFYPDGTPKGKDRLYNIDEVFNAMKAWNPSYIEI